MSNRVVVYEDEQTSRIRSDAEIVRENEEFFKLLGVKESEMNEEKKEDGTLEELMARKKAEKEKAHEELDTTEEVVDVRAEQPAEKKVKKEDNVKAEPAVSLKFGVIGAGQAGGRLAEVFYQQGYDVCAVNTAKQDLEFLDLPADNKFFLNYSLGGAGKDLEVGEAALEEDYAAVKSFVEEKLGDCDVMVVAASGGGGSGSGAAPILVEMVQEFDLPVVCIFVLPGGFDDSLAKFNTMTTLSKLSKQSKAGLINSLVLVDNAKIEAAYPDVSQAKFWSIANQAVVKPLITFNSVCAMPTEYEALDNMDFAESLLNSGNCLLLGSHSVSREEYEGDETALVESMMDNLDKGLLADGFDLSSAQTMGIVVTARQKVLEEIPYRAISYIFKYMGSEYNAVKNYKGVYALPSKSDDIEIHFLFSGLSLPQSRIEGLRDDAKKHTKTLDSKKKTSDQGMDIDFGDDPSNSAADEMMRKIKRKKGAMGKLINKSKKNRRRR